MSKQLKSTQLLKIEKEKLYGDQKDRTEMEPKPERDLIPVCPRRFNKKQKSKWRQVANILKNYGLFTAANQIYMELIVTALVRLEACKTWAEESKLRVEIHKCLKGLGLGSMGLAKLGQVAAKSSKRKKEEDLLS